MAKRNVAPFPSATGSRWSEAEARAVLADWQRSGRSMAAYARDHGLQGQRLAWWRKRLSGWSSPGALAPVPPLVPAVVVAAPASSSAVLVRLPRGVVVEVADATPSWLAALVAELEALP